MEITLPPVNILIVDDTPQNLRLLSQILSHQGYGVRVANSGPQAIQSVQRKAPDLILLDVMMPEMDGYTACAHFKNDPATRDIPVIFLSALDSVQDKIAAFKAGGVDYITKPFETTEVLARIATHLQLHTMRQQLQMQNQQLEQEVAERRRTEQLLRDSMQELEASNAELDAFAHTVAHDLKTPLSVIIGFSSLLEVRYSRLESERILENLHRITQTGYKMRDIINELLLLARIRKQETVSIYPLQMDKIVNEACNRLAELIAARHVTLILPESWPTALGYPAWVEEIWVNYLNNAIKYGGSADQTVSPRVELGWDEWPPAAAAPTESPIHYRFWVQDNGPGLTPEEQSRLFTQFTRLHQARAEGHGLGLSIVQRIAERLGGHVGVASAIGQGCRFYFTLPPATESSPFSRQDEQNFRD